MPKNPAAVSLGWRRRAIRGPIMAKPMFWLYLGNNRYTPTGSYKDAVSFTGVAAAKRFVEGMYA